MRRAVSETVAETNLWPNDSQNKLSACWPRATCAVNRRLCASAFFRQDISVVWPIIVLELAIIVLSSLFFRTLFMTELT